MHDRFIGNPNLKQVRQPEGTELCFAALTSSVSGESLETAGQALQAAFLSEEDGSTSPPFDAHLEVPINEDGSKTLIIDVIQGYEQEASNVEGVIRNIDARLKEEKPVALLYKKTDEPNSGMHWVLLTGYTYARDTDIVDGVVIMDPLRPDKYSANPLEVVGMIDRSMKADGVFAYELSVDTFEQKTVETRKVEIDSDKAIELEIVEVAKNELQKYFTWPTNMHSKEAVRAAIDTLANFPEAQDWPYQVLVIKGDERWEFITPEEYYDFEEPFPVVDGGNVIRLNGGPAPGQGFSMTVYIDGGQTFLNLVTGPDQDDQAQAIVAATVVPEGHDKVEDFFRDQNQTKS